MSGLNNASEPSEQSEPSIVSSLGIRLPSVRTTVRRNPTTTRRIKRSGVSSVRKSVRHRALDSIGARMTTETMPESIASVEEEESRLTDPMPGNNSSVLLETQSSQNDGNEESQRPEENNMTEASDETNVCIDLTEDDSFVTETNNENNGDSDADIECITTSIEETDVYIVSDSKRRRKGLNRSETSRSPIPLSEAEIIEIAEFTSNPSQPLTTPTGSRSPKTTPTNSLKKTIKCPVCLDEYALFNVSGKQLMSTNCGHLFCDICIKQVVRTSKQCPSCRKRIATHKSYHPIYL